MTNKSTLAGGISIHAVDISRGIPASGLTLRLSLLGEQPYEIAAGACGATGQFDHPITTGTGVVRGVYEVAFDCGAYYRAAKIEIPDPAFLDIATFRFGVDRVSEHFHLPFKFTPWGFSLFRGGA